jgi:hypothetical protein
MGIIAWSTWLTAIVGAAVLLLVYHMVARGQPGPLRAPVKRRQGAAPVLGLSPGGRHVPPARPDGRANITGPLVGSPKFFIEKAGNSHV